jgi:acetolactate synthase-1/2/3 large subunit
MPNCAELPVSLLEGYGVDTVFGIPGIHTVQLHRGLATSSIRQISPRYEQGAGFMADGYARASGRPGVCFLISGPGLTNALTPMMQALADSVPMLVVTAVAALIGDGRAQFTLTGLAAGVQERLCVVVLLWNNAGDWY